MLKVSALLTPASVAAFTYAGSAEVAASYLFFGDFTGRRDEVFEYCQRRFLVEERGEPAAADCLKSQLENLWESYHLDSDLEFELSTEQLLAS